jgi:hypothetical protein
MQDQVGYQPNEPIKGFLLYSGDVKVETADRELKLERPGLFGECSKTNNMLFMTNLPTA